MKWMTKAVVALLAATLAMSATTVWADEVYVELRGNNLETADDGYVNLLGSAEPAGASGVAVGFQPVLVDGLRLTGSVDGDGISGNRFQRDLSADWSRSRFMAGADYGVDVLDDRLRPFGRIGLGYSRQTLEYSADGGTYRDVDHGMAGLLAAGVEGRLLVPEADPEAFIDRLTLGLNVTGGYAWQSEANFDGMTSQDAPEEPDDDDPWRRGEYDAGSIQASGFSMSIGVVLGYRF